MTRSDAELLSLSGTDPSAYRELYNRHAERVSAFFEKRTGNADAALDLTAETFAQAWMHRHRFDDRHDGSCGPWLFGIARNLLLRAVRDRRLESEASAKLRLRADRASIEPADAWIEGLDDELFATLEGLPDGQRLALELRVIQDRPYEDVAHQMGVSQTAARVRVSRGLSTLRTSLIANPNRRTL